MTTTERVAEDYRQSHADKGEDYDRFIEGTPFDAYMAEWEARQLQQILPRLFPAKDARHLDFACGTGRIIATVAPHCRESTGVDISPTMLEVARAKCPAVTFVHADVTSSPVDLGAPFDLITAFRFFGNAQDELRARVLARLNHYLRGGGILIINSHRNPAALKNVLHRLTGGKDELDLTHEKLERLLNTHGFETVLRRPIGFWIFRNAIASRPELSAVSGERYERWFSHPAFVNRSPDAIVVAKKIKKLD